MHTAASTTGPDLTSYDVVLVNSSAGKDSQAMLDYLVEQAGAQGVPLARLVVVHADLGRVEWAGTRALAAEQAAHYGLRFEVVRREAGDLLDQVQARGMWPSSKARYCTSDQKRDQVAKLITRLAGEHARLGRPVRILNCLGLRAQESPARAAKQAFQVEKRASNSSRLSCCFCVFASKADLTIAAQHNPALLDAYCATEAAIGHQFTQTISIRSLRQAASTAQASPVTR